jgi:DNA polymerase-1
MASILHRFQISSPCAAIPQLPGAAGVGASGAATLLRRYGSLEAALAAGRRTGGKRLFKSIAATTPLPSLRKQKPTWSKAAALARKWELTLARQAN